MESAVITKPALQRFSTYLDVVRGRLWDSFHCNKLACATPGNTKMFIRNPTHDRPLIDCNMQMANMLPPYNEFVIEKVLLLFPSSCLLEDVRLFVESAVFTFYLLNKWYIRTPLISIPRIGQGHTTAKAPLKVCTSCGSVSLDLKCKSCGAPEWKYLKYCGEADPLNKEPDGWCLEIDLTGNEIWIGSQMKFYAQFDFQSSITMQGDFRFWTVLEGWDGRAIQ